MKRILSFTLVFATILSLLVTSACASSFSDVNKSHWAYSSISEMQKDGLVNGVGDGKFNPTGKLSRVQFLAMAVRFLEHESGTSVTPTSSEDYWGTPYYIAAEKLGLLGSDNKNALPLSTVENSRASLDADITRYEMSVIANNVLATLPEYAYDTSSVNSTVMPDYAVLSEQYKEAVCRMYVLGIITGQTDGSFNGDKTLTRAESCAVLSRLKAKYNAIYSPADGNLEVHFIDVGQADAALIICDDEAMLIDGGNVGDSDLIYAYLKQENVPHLKYIVATHAHEDHMGGLAGALNYADVDTFFCSITNDDSKFFTNVKSQLSKQGKKVTVPEAGSTYTLGGATFQFVGPVKESKEVNNMSLVLRLEYGDTSFLFTGDAEAAEEADILDAGYDISATVLKVGHHGSGGSSTYRFLREIAPDYAVISCETGNKYGHPHDEALSRLRDADVKLYRTDLQGTILCTSDGTDVAFTTAKNPTIETNPTIGNSDGGYIGNINSKVFHRPDCKSLPSEKNSVYFGNRMEAADAGYAPCGKCKP